jgi:hypothetical protein
VLERYFVPNIIFLTIEWWPVGQVSLSSTLPVVGTDIFLSTPDGSVEKTKVVSIAGIGDIFWVKGGEDSFVLGAPVFDATGKVFGITTKSDITKNWLGVTRADVISELRGE